MFRVRLARSNLGTPRQRLVVGLAAWIVYPILFLGWYDRFGVAFTPLAVLPLMITAWLFGLWPGVFASIALLPLHSFLFQIVGPPPPSPTGAPPPSSMYGPSILADLLLGGVIGFLSDLVEEVKDQIEKRHQAEASLRQAHDELEVRVQERTGALAQANQALEAEVNVRKQAEEGLRQRNLEAATLNELGNMLLTCRTTAEAYQVISEYAVKLFPGQAGALGIINSSRNLVEVAVTWGNYPPHEFAFSPDECWAIRRGQPHTVADPESHLICKHISRPVENRVWCVPMTAQGEALGILHLRAGALNTQTMPGERDSETENLQSLACSVAERIALGLVNMNLRDKLRNQAIRDPLTGLFNRRYMEETLEREMARALRRHVSFGLVMLDIDRFKELNDNFGHPAGDVVLQEMARVLGAQTRSEDIACRFGGEEFILVVPEIELPDLLARVEQMRQDIASLYVEYQHHAVRKITVSAGVAMFPQNGATAKELINAADGALYVAKRTGRNRAVVVPAEHTVA